MSNKLTYFLIRFQPGCNKALLEMFQIDYLGTAPYISCIPSVLHLQLSSNDRFLVLSSDGLYQYFSNEEVVAHITWFMEKVPEGDPAQYLIAELLFRAAKKNGQLTSLICVENKLVCSRLLHFCFPIKSSGEVRKLI